jgi:hypothetical protein
MAAPLPNEDMIQCDLRSNSFSPDPALINALDLILSDYLFAIRFSLQESIQSDTPMPIDQARMLLDFSRTMNQVFRKIMHPEQIDTEDNFRLQDIKRRHLKLPPHIQSWLKHHIGNDTQAIHFIIGDCVDDNQPIPVDLLRDRIMVHADAMVGILGLLVKSKRRLEQ